jgi:transposase
MLLVYRENPSFFAVAKRMGVHHQTVQRCIVRALAYGPLMALDDRPRPGKEPMITPEAKAWLVSLACDKAKDHGYPHELWTTRLLARHAREHGAAAGHGCLANLVQGSVCKILGQEEVKPHKVRHYLERRDAEFEQKMAEVLCVYREVQVLKKAAAKAKKTSSKSRKPVAIVSYDEKPGIQAIATTSPDLPPVAPTRHSRAITSTSVMARSACWPGSICSPARSTPWSKTATAAANSSNSSSFSIPLTRPERRSR